MLLEHIDIKEHRYRYPITDELYPGAQALGHVHMRLEIVYLLDIITSATTSSDSVSLLCGVTMIA